MQNNGIYHCPICGNIYLILDKKRGELICKNCGMVVQEKIISEDGGIREEYGRWFKNPNAYKERETRIGKSNKGLSPKEIELFKRLRFSDGIFNAKERKLNRVFQEFKVLASVLNLSKYTRMTIKHFIYQFMKKNSLKGRSCKSFVGAVTYLILAQQNIPVTFKKIADALDLFEIKKLKNTYSFILEKINLNAPFIYSNNFFKNLIINICQKLKLSIEIQNECCFTLDDLEIHILGSGKNPRGFIGALIYLISIKNKEKISQEKIAKALDITEVTIRKRVKEISKFIFPNLRSIVIEICQKLKPPKKIETECCATAEKIKVSLGDLKYNQLQKTAAAIVYLVSKNYKEKKSQTEVARIININRSTLKEKIEEIIKFIKEP